MVDALCYDPEHAQTIMSKWDVTHGEPPAAMGATLRRYTSPPPVAPIAANADAKANATAAAAGDVGTGVQTSAGSLVPWHVLSATQMELPRINDDYHLNSSYCIVYGWTAVALVRVNVCANTTTTWHPPRANQ